MTGERESFASRRALLTGAPALAVVAAVPIARATALSAVASHDPYVNLAADWYAQRSVVNSVASDEAADAAFDLWIGTEHKMTVARATTQRGALDGLRIAHSEFLEHFGGRSSPGGKFVCALIVSAIDVLEREVARG